MADEIIAIGKSLRNLGLEGRASHERRLHPRIVLLANLVGLEPLGSHTVELIGGLIYRQVNLKHDKYKGRSMSYLTIGNLSKVG